jgi:GntR family transcriptional regulator, carbon starvation induced regulator
MMDVMPAKRKVKPHKSAAARRTKSAHGKSKVATAQSEAVSTIDLRARLRKDIVSCELAPGQRLKFEELRARYDVGIGSLRETLMQLEADGLVVAESNRGFCVAPVTIADLEDVTELRVDIEKKALAQSIERGNDAWEAEIVTALHMLAKLEPEVAQNRSDYRDLWDERHARFHDALVAACPSPWLLRFRQVLFVQSQRYRTLSMLQSRKPGRVGDHRALVELTLARDVGRATAAMEAHIRRTAENVREWLTAHGTSGSTTDFTQDRDSRRNALAVPSTD